MESPTDSSGSNSPVSVETTEAECPCSCQIADNSPLKAAEQSSKSGGKEEVERNNGDRLTKGGGKGENGRYLIEYGDCVSPSAGLVDDNDDCYTEYQTIQHTWFEVGSLVAEICKEKPIDDITARHPDRQQIYEMVIRTLDLKPSIEDYLLNIMFYGGEAGRKLQTNTPVVAVGTLEFMLSKASLKPPLHQWRTRFAKLECMLGTEPRERLKIEMVVQDLSERLVNFKPYLTTFWTDPLWDELWENMCNDLPDPCASLANEHDIRVREAARCQPCHARINRIHPNTVNTEETLQVLVKEYGLTLRPCSPPASGLPDLKMTFWVEPGSANRLLNFTYDCEEVLKTSTPVQNGQVILQERYVTGISKTLQPKLRDPNCHIAISHGTEPELVSHVFDVMYGELNLTANVTVFGVKSRDTFQAALQQHHVPLKRVQLREEAFLEAATQREDVLMDVEVALLNPPSSKQLIHNIKKHSLQDPTHKTFLETVGNILASANYCYTDAEAVNAYQEEVLQAALQLPMIKTVLYCTRSNSAAENDGLVDKVVTSMRGKSSSLLRSFYTWKTEEEEETPSESGAAQLENTQSGDEEHSPAALLPNESPSQDQMDTPGNGRHTNTTKRHTLKKQGSTSSKTCVAKIPRLKSKSRKLNQRAKANKDLKMSKKEKKALDEKYAKYNDVNRTGIVGGQLELQAVEVPPLMAMYSESVGSSQMKLIKSSPWADGWFCALLHRRAVETIVAESAAGILAKAKDSGVLNSTPAEETPSKTRAINPEKSKPQRPQPVYRVLPMEPEAVMSRALKHHTKHARRYAFSEAKSKRMLTRSMDGPEHSTPAVEDNGASYAVALPCPVVGATSHDQPMALFSADARLKPPAGRMFPGLTTRGSSQPLIPSQSALPLLGLSRRSSLPVQSQASANWPGTGLPLSAAPANSIGMARIQRRLELSLAMPCSSGASVAPPPPTRMSMSRHGINQQADEFALAESGVLPPWNQGTDKKQSLRQRGQAGRNSSKGLTL